MEIPNYLVKEIDETLKSSYDLLQKVCMHCNSDGEYSHVSGRVFVVKNMLNALMEMNMNFKKTVEIKHQNET